MTRRESYTVRRAWRGVWLRPLPGGRSSRTERIVYGETDVDAMASAKLKLGWREALGGSIVVEPLKLWQTVPL